MSTISWSAVVSRTIVSRREAGEGLGLVADEGRGTRDEGRGTREGSGCTMIGTKFRRVAVHSALLFFPTPEASRRFFSDAGPRSPRAHNERMILL